ncbi:MAG: hypothetical protein NWF01_07160 [Candidatus Bathyarchaeota archaeon]|nr:hypothetical protein [Candidatus Bathyarchaeota archaeon]
MKSKAISVVLLSLLLVSMVFLYSTLTNNSAAQALDVYVGVDMAYCTAAGPDEAKSIIDQVSGFTNLFVVGTTGITDNSTVLNDVLQHAYDRGLSFLSFIPNTFGNVSDSSNPDFVSQAAQWLEVAQANWGDHLLGFLHPVIDEPGAHILDNWPGGTVILIKAPSGQSNVVSETNSYVTNYTTATSKYETLLNNALHNSVLDAINSTKKYPLFTSDNVLYWFDYKGGYDTIFAEFGWNNSRPLNVALCRGAAQMQNKDWGVIITYTYTKPPYLESGDDLYADMVYAYNSGAKYITIFNSNENYTQGILQPQHLQAMQRFWEYAKTHPRNSYPVSERTAYVLPYGYAYGFRGPQDKVWGLWQSINEVDNFNQSVIVNSLLQEYGDKLDIIYDDNLQPIDACGYSALLYWNDTTLLPSLLPAPWPSFTPLPTFNFSPLPSFPIPSFPWKQTG